MRVPWWLRNPPVKKLQQMKDQFSESLVDVVSGLEKTPPHYQAAYTAARSRKPRPVHYRPPATTHVYDREHGIVKQIDEDQPITPITPPEAHYGLWAGEGIVKGFTQRNPNAQRAPRWWFPYLRETAFYSEVLDKHYLIVVTNTALERIDEAFGFDNYILKTPEAEMQSRLGMRFKREMLIALANKALYPHDPEKRDEILDKYKEHIIPVEEAEWVGLTLKEAVYKANKEQQRPPVPLKEVFQDQLIVELQKRKTESPRPS